MGQGELERESQQLHLLPRMENLSSRAWEEGKAGADCNTDDRLWLNVYFKNCLLKGICICE